LQYLQFLHAVQFLSLEHVPEVNAKKAKDAPNKATDETSNNLFFITISFSKDKKVNIKKAQ